MMSTKTTKPEGSVGEIGGDLLSLTVGEIAGAAGQADDADGAIREKLNEYKVLVAPVERAIRELHLARGMLRARAEDEINALSPELSALAEALGISTLDLLTSPDRGQFLHDAVLRSDLPVDEVRRRIASAVPDMPRLGGARLDDVRDAAI